MGGNFSENYPDEMLDPRLQGFLLEKWYNCWE